MTIKVASKADAEAIAEVHVASWRSAYRGLMPRETLDHLDRDARRSLWAREIEERPGETIVSLDRGRVVGFANLGPYRGGKDDLAWGEIRALYVLERCWRRGVGSALLAHALASFGPGVRTVALWVLGTNTRARAFYKRHGFMTDGAVKTETQAGARLREVRMTVSIGPR